MNDLHFDEETNLICECVLEGWMDEFHVTLTKEGTLVIACSECGSAIRFEGVHIPEKENMMITNEQAEYWMKVALKDIVEDNHEGAHNVHRWLEENNARSYASTIALALQEAGA